MFYSNCYGQILFLNLSLFIPEVLFVLALGESTVKKKQLNVHVSYSVQEILGLCFYYLHKKRKISQYY